MNYLEIPLTILAIAITPLSIYYTALYIVTVLKS
jgi:hypothetical protein